MTDETASPSRSPAPEAMEAFCDWLRLVELGQPSDFDAFCAEHPVYQADLVRLRDEYERVTAILERLSPTNSFSARLRERYGDSVDPGVDLSGEYPGPTSPGSKPSSGRMAARLSALRPSVQRYEPRGEIARGGMGAILKVWDRELRRMLAMKVMLARGAPAVDDSDADVGERRLSRFLEEAQITAQLDHPGIVPVHDLGIDEKGRVYFTMQLIEGRDLREIFELARLQRDGWTRPRVLWAMLRVCEAMAYAHSKSVVHRDLKPANIMVGRFGETYVMDWGLAKVVGREDLHDLRLEEKHRAGKPDEGRRVITDRSEGSDDGDSPLKTLDGDVVGTPAYMPPEQALGHLSEVGPQSDVYSVGAMLYHLLAGQMPYEPLGEKVPTTTILESVRTRPPWPLQKLDPTLDGELVAICSKAMAREQSQRYGDMMEFAADLQAYLEGRVVRAYTTGVLYEFKKWVRRNKPTAAALAALVLLAIASIAAFIFQQQRSLDRLAIANEEIERERQLTEDARVAAEEAAAELLIQRDRANENEQDAIERKRAADESSRLAQERARRNQLLSYHAHIVAADFSMRIEDVSAAKVSLEATSPELRGWEWRHLELSTRGDVEELVRIDTGVAGLSAGLDGARLACIGLDLRVRVVDVETGVALSTTDVAPYVSPSGLSAGLNARRVQVALSPNGGFGLAASLDQYILVFNTTDGRVLEFLSHLGTKTTLAISRDGLRFVSASEKGTAVVWKNSVVGAQVGETLVGHEGPVLCAALSPRAERVITGGADGSVRIWDAESGDELAELAFDRSREVTACTWAPPRPGKEDTVAIAYSDGSIAIWDVAQMRLLTVMHGHNAGVGALCFGPRGELLFSGSDDATVRMWRTATGEPLRTFRGHDREVTGLALVAEGTRLASSSLDHTVRLWNPDWDPAVTRIESRGTLAGVGFGPDSDVLVTFPRVGLGRRYDATTGEMLGVLDLGEPGDAGGALEDRRAMAISANGRWLATASDARTVRVLDERTGGLAVELSAQRRRLESLALSSGGELVASGATDGSIWIWRWRAGLPALELSGHRRSVLGMAFSPDATALASVGRDRALRIWDTSGGDLQEMVADAHELPILCVAFSSDGETVATGSQDGTARLWKRGNSRPERTLVRRETKVTAVAFDPTGRRLITGHSNGELVMWDVQTGDRLLTLEGHTRSISAVSYSPDGRRIASCGSDPLHAGSELRVWESNPAEGRHAARVQAARVRAKALPIVDALYERYVWPEAVLAMVPAASDGLTRAVGAAVERLARLRAFDAELMSDALLAHLARPEVDATDCERALELATYVQSVCGPGADTLAALGAAQVRARNPREGLITLRASSLERGRDDRVAEARVDAFRALALAALDRDEEAREALDGARQAILNLDAAEDDEIGPLMDLEPLLSAIASELEPAAGER